MYAGLTTIAVTLGVIVLIYSETCRIQDFQAGYDHFKMMDTANYNTRRISSSVAGGIYDVVVMNSSQPGISLKECMKRVHTEYLSATQLKDWKRHSSRGCGYARCQFMNGTERSVVPLLSYPGSGNTWMRGLLEKATGICTGAPHHDMSLIKGGFMGHGVMNGAVVVAKMHRFPNNEAKMLDHILFIVRNPFDAIVAEWQRVRTGRNHIGVLPRSAFGNNTSWTYSVRLESVKWRNLATTLIMRHTTGNFKLHIIRYEDLKADKVRETESVLQFLGFNYDKKDLAKCLQEDFETFKRPHPNSTFDHYTSSQKKVVNARISELIRFVESTNSTDLNFLNEYIF